MSLPDAAAPARLEFPSFFSSRLANHLPNELHQVYLSRTVEPQTWFIPPADIGHLPPPDSDIHCIAFTRKATRYYFFSEPREIERLNNERLFRLRLPGRLREQRRYANARELVDDLIDIYRQREPHEDSVLHFRKQAHTRPLAEYAAYLAYTLFDCQLLVLPEDR